MVISVIIFIIITLFSVFNIITLWCRLRRSGGSRANGQRSADGGAVDVHGPRADDGRLPVLPATVRFQPARPFPARRWWRRGRYGRRIQPSSQTPSAPPSPPSPAAAAPAPRTAAAVARVAQSHAVVVRAARVRRAGRTVRQRGQRVTAATHRRPVNVLRQSSGRKPLI